ncbi:MAG: hypothetical protein ACLRXC_12280 [[Clostridium] leptum]
MVETMNAAAGLPAQWHPPVYRSGKQNRAAVSYHQRARFFRTGAS